MKQLVFCLAVLLCPCSLGWAQGDKSFDAVIRLTEPLTAQQERETFRLPPGFTIQLVASEPDIQKPLNMAFDAKGRLWLTDTVEYPFAVPPGKAGRDTIKVLEDTDGDGRADKIDVFADGLNIPIGIYPVQDGAIAFSIPDIWHLRDTDGDGKSDERRRLFGPMGYERDTHGLNNAFRRGFDGWLYACHGFNNETVVKGPDGHEIRMQSGNTYRLRLDGSRIEQFTWGQVNPFGMTFDPLGNFFTADCHSKPIYQLLRNGYYPSFGKPHDGLGFVPEMMLHTHGSTAISGIAFYTGANFPAEFHGNMFSGNVMTSRVNRNTLTYRGATVRAHEAPDFVVTTDPWFRPVDVQVGPDGVLYVADFYNKIIGHYEVGLDHPQRDRHRGRIWRIIYVGVGEDSSAASPKRPVDLNTPDVSPLLDALEHPSLSYRMLAMHRLADQFGEQAVSAVRERFETSAAKSGPARGHLVWLLHRLGALSVPDIQSAATDQNRDTRVHALRVLSETAECSEPHRRLTLNGLRDADSFVQLAAADALAQHPHAEHVRPLLAALAAVPAEDVILRHAVRLALRNQFYSGESFEQIAAADLSAADRDAIVELMPAVKSEQAGSFLVRFIPKASDASSDLGRLRTLIEHAARYAPEPDTAVLSSFVQTRFADDNEYQLQLLTSIRTGFDQRGLPPNDALRSWAAALVRRLLKPDDGRVISWSAFSLTGQATGAGPWATQARPSADGDQRSVFFNSLLHGEQFTGILRSEAFPVPPRLTFHIAGHNGFPSTPVDPRNVVRLRDAANHAVLAESLPPRNDTAQPVEWKLDEHAGKQGYVEIVDGDDRVAYAWLAVGRFSLAGLNSSRTQQNRNSAADLVAQFQLREFKPELHELLLSDSTGAATQATVARALSALEPDSRIDALLPILGDAGFSVELRRQCAQVVVARDAKSLHNAVSAAMRAAPQRLQLTLAETLAADGTGAETLVQLVRVGHASARLLKQPTVRDKLLAVKRDDITTAIRDLTANLPSLDDAVVKLIERRRTHYLKAASSAERGAPLFQKHCAVCHQLDGQGPLIGPQLDGVGRRGLDRLIEDVLDPNRNVDVAFRTSTLVLKDGKVVSGLLRRQEGAVLILVDQQGKEFSVPESTVEEQVKSQTSLMPVNVAEIISEQDFDDLLVFLLSKTQSSPSPDAPRKES